MPKMKSHSGAGKRLKKLKSGKVKFYKVGRRHLLTKKSTKRKRQLRNGGYITQADIGHVISLLVIK